MPDDCVEKRANFGYATLAEDSLLRAGLPRFPSAALSRLSLRKGRWFRMTIDRRRDA